MEPKFLTESEVNIIRGKNLVGKASKEDVEALLDHIFSLEEELLAEADENDFFGTEGWRHHAGIGD